MASLPAPLIQRVHESGKGLICDFWVEQAALLQHGAVGWFLTHGGFKFAFYFWICGDLLMISFEVPFPSL